MKGNESPETRKRVTQSDREAIECYNLWRKYVRSRPEPSPEHIERMARVFDDQAR